jgi:ligand-binding sensor domain-containing protein
VSNFSLTEEDGSLKATAITALMPESNGNLIVGTSTGLLRFSFITESFETLIEEIDTLVSAIACDKQGTLWISTRGRGVYSYNTENESTHHYPMQEVKGNIETIYSDNSNRLWIISHNSNGNTLWKLDKSQDKFMAIELGGLLPSPMNSIL